MIIFARYDPTMIETFLTNEGKWRFRILDESENELASSPSFPTEAEADAVSAKLAASLSEMRRKVPGPTLTD